MRRFISKIKTACVLAVMGFKNEGILTISTFNMLTSVLNLILKVGEENKPYMSHIAYVNHEDNKETPIISIWAGPSMDASPTARISELLKENAMLKSALRNQSNADKINVE